MDECLALLDGLATLGMVRADNGFFDGKFRDFLEEKVLPYLVKARMTKFVMLAMVGATSCSAAPHDLADRGETRCCALVPAMPGFHASTQR